MQKRKPVTRHDVQLAEDWQALFVLEFAKDLDVLRAAQAIQISVDTAYEWLGEDKITAAIRNVMLKRAEQYRVDPEWLMQEWQDLYELCKQHRAFSTAVQCLKEMGRLGTVDAYAPEKVELKGDREIVEKLARARNRKITGKVVTFT